MMKLIKQTFLVLKSNLMLLQPVLIYFLVINFAVSPLISPQVGLLQLVSLLTAFLLTTAMISGWFYMTKTVVEHVDVPFVSEEARVEFDLAAGKRFFMGVGEYFLSVSIVAFLNLLFFIIFIYLVMKLGHYFFERPEVTVAQFKTLAASTNINSDMFKVFTKEQIMQINTWTLYLSACSSVFSFLTMYFLPSVFYEGGKNPFKAIFNGLKFLFKNFAGSLFMIVYLSLIGFVVTIFVSLGVSNIFLGVLGLIMLVFYVCFYMTLIFLFYEKKQKITYNTGLDSVG